MAENNIRWLIIGGAGYIGAHVSRTFLKNNINIFILDNLSTGLKERIPKSIKIYNFDCSNSQKINEILNKHNIQGIVHLAAFKQARESKRKPLKYWENNISAMIGVINSIKNSPVKYFLFSSSCSIYGDSKEVTEESDIKPLSPYGRTKAICEMILDDCAKELKISCISLRYFNVIGNDNFDMAHDNSEECLVPSIYNCYMKNKLPEVFGTNFNTRDGSAMRDYLDVRDLSDVHYLAANYLMNKNINLNLKLNVGTGKPNSVLEIIKELSNNLSIPNKINDVGRNSADPDAIWANTNKFKKLFDWEPKWTIQESIKSYLQNKIKK